MVEHLPKTKSKNKFDIICYLLKLWRIIMIKITNKGKKSWVTFTILPEGAQSVEISGEWNEWKNEPMKKKKNGSFYITKVMDRGNTYQFGYKLNDGRWVCDDDVEKVMSPFNSQNSLLKV